MSGKLHLICMLKLQLLPLFFLISIFLIMFSLKLRFQLLTFRAFRLCNKCNYYRVINCRICKFMKS